MRNLTKYLLVVAVVSVPLLMSRAAEAAENHGYRKVASAIKHVRRNRHQQNKYYSNRRHLNARGYRSQQRGRRIAHRSYYPQSREYYESYSPVHYETDYYQPVTVYRGGYGYYPRPYSHVSIGGHLNRNSAEILATGLIIGTLLGD